MPLNRKWRSMDLFGSHESLSRGGGRPLSVYDKSEHRLAKNPFRHRLSSSGSRDETTSLPARLEKDADQVAEGGLMQKCVIIQRDEKGYGFTVSGDNPVFVASVKQDGAAAKAGVLHGDRIVKVNGTLVTQRNHLDVVKLIKSGSYVVLTLLGKPTPASPITQQSNVSTQRDSVAGRVTAPQPVDPDKDRELWQQKVHMTRAMYETAKEDFEKLQKQYVSKPSEKLHAQLLDKERTVKALDNQLKQLTGGNHSDMSPSLVTVGTPGRFSDLEHGAVERSAVHSWASSQPRGNQCDLSSMSDSPPTSPSISPTPNDPILRHNGQDIEESVIGHTEIIHIDDEEVNSEDDQVSDPGPFAEMKLLENKPAYLAVFLNYLISNSDPSPVLFHIISDLYQRSAASTKELRKWAYEIYSTFIYKRAPLSISVEDIIIGQVENVLSSTGSRADNDSVLRTMFSMARQCVQLEIAELLSDFCNRKYLGLGNVYGIQKVHDSMDRSSEIKVAEELLMPHVKIFGAEENGRGAVVDKDLATGWALATFLRSLGGPKSAHSAMLDRVQTFMMKDKKSIKFPGSRSSRAKAVKGHQLTLQHFYLATFCNFCGNLIWGVGYQGYQCQSCEMTLHKSCAEEITEQCGGKKKRISAKLPLGVVMPSRKPGQQQLNPANELPAHAGTPGRSNESKSSLPVEMVTATPTQPYPREEDPDLAGLPTGHSVRSIINRYQFLTSPTDHHVTGTNLITSGNERRGSSDLNRSGSLNSKEEKSERPPRRAKSDVDVDADTFKAINQSGSSSASSLSSRSVESPGNSTDNVSDLLRAQHDDPDLDVEAELLPLKQVLPDDILRKLKPKEKKRQDVINELFYTERAHLRNLKVLDLLFYRPMCQEKGIMVDLAMALFPNMEEMISLHVSLVRDIKERSQSAPVVKDVGDLLLKRFDGEAGERFRKGCAEYCRNQAFALDALKKQTRKEPKLQQFLHDAESSSLCRRLQLKDLVPSQMQRLTKYPLLIDSLLKYTTNSEEYRRLERALERCRHILAYVNQAVKECESYHKLKDIQKKLDRRSVEVSNDPNLTDLKNFDLTLHKLIFDGPLTWNLRSHRTLDMHVLLLDDMLVLLQKQDDKYLLKCQNTNVQVGRDDKYTHFPILMLQNLLARPSATEKKSFFVLNFSKSRAQMYQFTASSSELRLKWCKLINDKADEFKKTSKIQNLGSQASPLEQVSLDRNRLSRISRKGRSNNSTTFPESTISPTEDVFQVSDKLSEQLDLDEDPRSEGDLIPPEEVSIADAITAQSASVSSSLAAFSPGITSEDENVSSTPADSNYQKASVGASVYMEQIKVMATEMNVILTKLASAVSSNSEEKHSLRQELQKAQQQLDSLKQMQKQMTESGIVHSGRTSPRVPFSSPAGGNFDIPSLPCATATTKIADAVQTVEDEELREKYSLEVEPVVIHEATLSQLEESMELLSLSTDPAELVPVIATQTNAGEVGLVEDTGDDDDDDNEVSVADLPLPDLISISEVELVSHAVDVDDGELDSDDTDTLTLKMSSQELSSLTTTAEDLDGEEREVISVESPEEAAADALMSSLLNTGSGMISCDVDGGGDGGATSLRCKDETAEEGGSSAVDVQVIGHKEGSGDTVDL